MTNDLITKMYGVWPEGTDPEYKEQVRGTLVKSLKKLGYRVDKDNNILRGSQAVGFTDDSGSTIRIILDADKMGELEQFAQTYQYQKATKREPALI
jgi:hypothetical protein